MWVERSFDGEIFGLDNFGVPAGALSCLYNGISV